MDLLYTITHPSRIHDIKFSSRPGSEGEYLLVGAEDHKVTIYEIPKAVGGPKIIAELIGHTNRLVTIYSFYSASLTKHTG